MRKTKKVFTVLLTGVLMASTLCACGETKEAETEAVTEATTVADTEAETEAVTEATTEAEDTASEDSESSDSSDTSETDYSAGTNAEAAEVEEFAQKIKSTVENGDWETLAGMAEYPVMVNGAQVASKDELLSNINEKGVSENFVNAIKNESCSGMTVNGQGVAMADGEVWFRDSLEGNDLVIITFNGLY